MKQIQGRDVITTSRRVVTSDGYLKVPGTLSRTGIQEYRASELGLDGGQMRIVRLYRAEAEVFKDKSLESFDGLPVTLDHPPEVVNSANWQQYAMGEVRNIQRDGDLVSGDLFIRSKAAIDAINGGKVELSNGYMFTLDMTPGKTPNGLAYDGQQLNIRGNHVAIVAAGRCGSACRISDSKPHQKENEMTTQKVVVDGMSLEVSDTAAVVIGRLQNQLSEAVKAKDCAAQLSKDEVAELTKKHVAELADSKAKEITAEALDVLVKERTELLAQAKRLAPSVATDGKKCGLIRAEVIAAVVAADATAKAVSDAVLAGKELASADESLVKSAFNAVAAAVKTEPAKTNDQALAAGFLGLGGGQKAPALTLDQIYQLTSVGA
jgi:uncharacterized protein